MKYEILTTLSKEHLQCIDNSEIITTTKFEPSVTGSPQSKKILRNRMPNIHIHTLNIGFSPQFKVRG